MRPEGPGVERVTAVNSRMRTHRVFCADPNIMRHTLPILFLVCVPALHAQNVVVPWSGSPFADGVISPGEWSAAPTIAVPSGASDTCRVALAADGWGLFLAFLGHLESNARFPEVLLDTQHDHGGAWNADDHWFHVSATCCHHSGAYGVYDDCSPLPVDWSGHPLFNAGAPATDTVEVAIPWYYLGIAPQAGDTLGFAAVLTNTATAWQSWPAGADHLSPATWGHLVIPGTAAVNEEGGPEHGLVVFPSPASRTATIRWGDQAAVDPGHVRICDFEGRSVNAPITRTDRGLSIDVSSLAEGLYLLTITDAAGAMRIGRVVVHH